MLVGTGCNCVVDSKILAELVRAVWRVWKGSVLMHALVNTGCSVEAKVSAELLGATVLELTAGTKRHNYAGLVNYIQNRLSLTSINGSNVKSSRRAICIILSSSKHNSPYSCISIKVLYEMASRHCCSITTYCPI